MSVHGGIRSRVENISPSNSQGGFGPERDTSDASNGQLQTLSKRIS